ncbi:MAG: rare lipoprotein [Sphingomonadales bacterium]|jgi:rare lipoprotein A (peptidoglycan hydrolase)|nr:rare lipoprotein [Sphingomonadales bacterium]
MRTTHGPVGGHSQLNGEITRCRSGRVAGIAISLALLGVGALGSTALAQTGGASTPGDGATAAQTPAPAGPGWTVVQKATWYGPGLWGNSTACGMVLTPTTIGVANKNLPCGTSVTFSYGDRTAAATVIDRGPYRKGYAWDLTKKLAKRLNFIPVGAGAVTATVTLPAP